jgi:hypothetical protein
MGGFAQSANETDEMGHACHMDNGSQVPAVVATSRDGGDPYDRRAVGFCQLWATAVSRVGTSEIVGKSTLALPFSGTPRGRSKAEARRGSTAVREM